MRPARLLFAALSCAGCGEPDGAPSGAMALPAAAHDAPAETAADAGRSSSVGWFEDVTAGSGLAFVHDAGVTPERQLPETMGAGGALADLDGDGDLDAYLVQSGPLPHRPGRTPRPTNRLFANDGAGHFLDVSSHAGAAAHDGYGMGVAAGDVDGDADLDLLVTNLGPDVLLANEGGLVFSDRTAASGVSDERWTGSAAFFDADGDGDLDLFVAAYVQVDLENPPWCGRREPGWRSYCHPDAFAGLPSRFWRNDGGGRFTEATAAAGLTTPPGRPGKGLGVLALDVDADADLDLYVANDSVENTLWLNRGDGTFEDGTLLSGTGVNAQGLTEAGMGLAAGDTDGDLDPELFVTNFDDESNTLYRNDGDALFTDVTARVGLDAPSRLPVGFGTVLADLDDDGDLDLAVTNGHIIDNIHLYHDGKTHAQRALLFENDGSGRFRDASTQGGDFGAIPLVGRGLYAGDVDGDGRLDLLLTQCNAAAVLYRNRGGPQGAPGGSSVEVLGLAPGSRVLAHLTSGATLAREVGPQPSYFGQTAAGAHVGLGRDRLAALTLLRPGAAPVRLELLEPLAAGRLAVVETGGVPQLQVLPARGTMPLPDPPAPASPEIR